ARRRRQRCGQERRLRLHRRLHRPVRRLRGSADARGRRTRDDDDGGEFVAGGADARFPSHCADVQLDLGDGRYAEIRSMKRSGVDLLVGLFVLLGFAALAFLALRAGNMSSALGLGPTYTATARFDNIGGLKPRAAVRSAGVVVGRVESIRFDDDTYQAEVSLALDQRFQFPKD